MNTCLPEPGLREAAEVRGEDRRQGPGLAATGTIRDKPFIKLQGRNVRFARGRKILGEIYHFISSFCLRKSYQTHQNKKYQKPGGGTAPPPPK